MRSRLERELSVWIDMAMERMEDYVKDGMHLPEEERLEEKLNDIDFRDSLVEATVSMLGEAVRCKKIAKILEIAGMNKAYELKMKVYSDRLEKLPPIHAP
ncbi:MAG: hypothetical protein QXW10_02420 [Candidatus Micrarchaeaceae archaeon]